MDRPIWSGEFIVRSFDVDAHGLLSAARLAGYLQDAASRSADAHGFGLSHLNQRGLTWVLSRQHWKIDEPIVMGDELHIETWPSGVDRWAALRDFRLLKHHRDVGRVVSSWFVLEVATRRPVRPTSVLIPEFHAQTAHVMPIAVEPLPSIDEPSLTRQFDVRYTDIDVNQHVTNSSYITWAMEAVDVDMWRQRYVTSLDIQYTGECGLGSSVLSHSRHLPNGQVLHNIKRELDGKEIARGLSAWTSK